MMKIPGIQPLVDWLNYNGFTMVTKAAKEFTDSQGRRKIKGNMDIELTVMQWSWRLMLTILYCFPETATSAQWLNAVQRQGVGCLWYPQIAANHPMIADELGANATTLSS